MDDENSVDEIADEATPQKKLDELDEAETEAMVMLERAKPLREYQDPSSPFVSASIELLAGKVVATIACGFAGYDLFNEYAKLTTMEEVERARSAVAKHQRAGSDACHVEELQFHALNYLRDNDVPEHVAEEIVRAVIERCERRFPRDA